GEESWQGEGYAERDVTGRDENPASPHQRGDERKMDGGGREEVEWEKLRKADQQRWRSEAKRERSVMRRWSRSGDRVEKMGTPERE
ncbi:hypothetical protein AMECASPLE_023159, partial [Ameca splendens]